MVWTMLLETSVRPIEILALQRVYRYITKVKNMHYVMIEERLVESLRMKWEDAKRTKLEYYIVNVNPECWSQYKARMSIDRIQPYLITNMSSNARRALTLLCTRSHKLGIEVASWYQNVTNLKTCKVCNEGMVENECHLLFTCSTLLLVKDMMTYKWHT